MVLDKIPGTQLFTQRDVRETPASTATATSVGLTDLNYILISTDADTTRDRVITAGEGIDFDDAGAKSTFTINGENATTTNKGIASFNTDDFSVTSGAVSLDADVCKTIDGDSGTATAAIHNFDILGGTGIDTLGANNDITISMEAASTSNVGGMEIATIAETQTGTDATRAVSPDGLFEVLSPIGAIIAWAKSMTSVPQTLPTGWVECDGTVINDAASPMNGETLPDLNGNEFLRGAATSGGTGGGTTGTGSSHNHSVSGTTSSGSDPDAGLAGAQITWSEDEHTHTFSVTSGNESAHTHSSQPKYYDVVWIMRVK